ncbi:MAG: hypothetical protein GF331_26880 [Chitinivibrionales bacterium]|nr:hypothetical protein [Chitinivibrionales bacterium]
MRKKSTSEYRKFSELDFKVPRILAKISRRCLALDSADRYPDADSLLAALRKSHTSLTSRTPQETMRAFAASPAGKSDQGASKSARIAIPIGIGIAAVLALGFGIRILLPGSEQKPPSPPPPVTTLEAPAVETPAPDAAVSDAVPGDSAPQPPRVATERSRPRVDSDTKKPETPERSRAASSRRALSTPAATPKRTAGPRPKQSPLERLRSEYGTTDYIEIGTQALQQKAYADAILAFEQVKPGDKAYTKASVYLLESYVLAGKLAEARGLVRKRRGIKDAQFDLLAGELARKAGDTATALERYQSAMLKPSRVRPVSAVRSDALCYTARIHTAQYHGDPSSDNRIQALNAWFALKRHHVEDQSHPRFKEANRTMAGIR